MSAPVDLSALRAGAAVRLHGRDWTVTWAAQVHPLHGDPHRVAVSLDLRAAEAGVAR